ncbi:unnamed protein product [Paramecium pentaurelia]|uniref:Ankyrin repeat-containing domain n=1 Tax=Paramecium pentaurelia TaxID=43138 RepID=A0A8S1XG23_9CILI|nr:unnamed protein product [Paramecium pentaurelia]
MRQIKRVGSLYQKLHYNNLQLVKALLAKKVDVNFLKKIDKSTPLSTLIQLNFIEGAQALLQTHQVDLEVEIEGRSYLEHAVVIGTVQIIQLLMSNQDLPNETYYIWQQMQNKMKTHNFQFKMKFDQQIKMKIKRIFYIYYQFEQFFFKQSYESTILVYNGIVELLNAIIKRPINKPLQIDIWNQQNKEENTSLHIAAINDKQLFLNVLLSNKDNVNLDVNKLNRAGLNYQQIIEDRKKKVELEQQEQQVRKRLIAEDSNDNNKGLKKQKLDNRRKRIKVKIKRSRSQQRDIIEEGRYKNRFLMLDIFAIVILGFYIVLQFSIKKK